jgi:hypothetical protein
VLQGTLPTFSIVANVTHLTNAPADILASDYTSTDSTKVKQDPNINMAANLSPSYPAQKQKVHATIYNNIHNRQTSKLHSP